MFKGAQSKQERMQRVFLLKKKERKKERSVKTIALNYQMVPISRTIKNNFTRRKIRDLLE